jgi:hypothetical protein
VSKRQTLAKEEFEIVTHEQYTGLSSDELNKQYGLTGFPCTHEPPHGIRLPAEKKFVVLRHHGPVWATPRRQS